MFCQYYTVSTSIFRLEDGFVGVTGIDEMILDEFGDFLDKCEAREYIQVPALVFKTK